ncbi:MAG: hypothetical protein EZS28_045584 [Streblomastix strix]|uniref:Uncharacterized protein n=1 Tax=Streblomastix strix TaxID=222440 RepID=A0A5J4TM52_9EUKA|nr:MAG: hypothetical protein EZS28_045584 [Streblomastix strix]
MHTAFAINSIANKLIIIANKLIIIANKLIIIANKLIITANKLIITANYQRCQKQSHHKPTNTASNKAQQFSLRDHQIWKTCSLAAGRDGSPTIWANEEVLLFILVQVPVLRAPGQDAAQEIQQRGAFLCKQRSCQQQQQQQQQSVCLVVKFGGVKLVQYLEVLY